MSSKPFYNHIAGLRGIAIVLVMLFHLSADGSTALFQHLRPQFEAILEEKSQTAESPAQ